MDFSQIVNIAQIIGILILIYGMWLGLKQFKLLRMQRTDLAIMECARSFEDKEFTEAYRLLTTIEPGLSIEEMKELGEEYEIAALRVGMKFETIGLLVFKGVIPIHAIEDLVGGASIAIWKKLENWAHETREHRSHPTFWEWYQWLVDRLNEREEYNSAPAFENHKNWKEPSF